jgi:hypothetical protein
MVPVLTTVPPASASMARALASAPVDSITPLLVKASGPSDEENTPLNVPLIRPVALLITVLAPP